jgi:pimeloyl-ACP methyl ester carboxylesterase
MSPEPFSVAWPTDAVDRLRARISAYRAPVQPPNAGWRFGCDPAFLSHFCAQWTNAYDVAACQLELNRYPQFTHDVGDGMRLHFVHVRGEAQGRRPLMLIHGWPGSHYQFWPVIDALAFPSRHGGRTEDAFDLVIPSLPGYAFSTKPSSPVGPRRTAAWFCSLMQTIGYDRYFVSGTDWGVVIAPWMAFENDRAVRGIHIDSAGMSPAAEPNNAAEHAWKAVFAEHYARLGAYYHLHSTKVQSLAYAMADNPVAQAAWILERLHDWADLGGRSVEDIFGLDRLITSVMLYVMTDSFVTASWFYTGAEIEGSKQMSAGQRVLVPTGYSAFADARNPNPPRSWVEKGYNVVCWKEHARGGHFAATEAPDIVVGDLRFWASTIERERG